MKVGKWDVAIKLSSQLSETYNIGSGKDAYSICGPWRERNSELGEAWLRSAAQSGNTFAMQRLAERLMSGKGIPANSREASYWVNRAVDEGNVSARGLFGSWILDGQIPGQPDLGQRSLTAAAEAGLIPAATEVGIRFLYGSGFATDIATGEYWLRVAAEAGDRLAMILLGRYLFQGRYLDLSPEEGRHWLTLSKADGEGDAPNSGEYVYLRAINEQSQVLRSILTNEAARMFLNGHGAGKVVASTNLAYLIRRHEVSSDGYPRLEELLSTGLSKMRPFAIVNEALRCAAGVQCSKDWEQGDHLIGKLPGTSGVLEWWTVLLEEGDLEGHLVFGWLVRHGLTTDPDGMTPEHRFSFLKGSSWHCPSWLN